jgi:predicted phosphate transport protein (TIGR00153 family)
MFGRFMPREVKFFDLFNAHTKEIVRGADALVALLAELNRSQDAAMAHAEAIDTIEARADKITDETISMLHATFITPIDRDEIHQLIKHLDDVLDTIQDAAGTIATYDVRRATPHAIRFGEIIRACVESLEQAVNLLHDMDNGQEILSVCAEISRLESEADRVLRDAMSKLFREENDMRELIKLKATYELLETVTDCCERVANIIESIVLENS